MDKDRTGYLNINEIEEIYKKLNIPYTKHGLLKLFEEIDLDNDCSISFDELVRFFDI
jgi:Ca2+-binding EF-hand superfamily protein